MANNKEFIYTIDEIQKWVLFIEEEKRAKKQWIIMVKPGHMLINNLYVQGQTVCRMF